MKTVIAFAAAFCLLPPALATDISVDQANGQFSQTVETLSHGDALILVNKDTGPHDISVIDSEGDPTDLGVQPPGASVKIKFADPGTYNLRCAIAPSMHMSVTVN